MNPVIETMLNHRSYRIYDENQPVEERDLDAIIRAAQSGPNWVNGQHVSIIKVNKGAKRQRLMELCGNQAHIVQAPVFLVFCADFYRTKLACESMGKKLEFADNTEALLVGTVDVGIALGNAVTAAESLGYGTVPIGSIRRHSLEVIRLLELPEYVIPVSGLCVGRPGAEQAKKSRLPKECVYFEDAYDRSLMEKESFRAYLRSPESGATWAERMALYYGNPRTSETPGMLRQQGFLCKDLQN